MLAWLLLRDGGEDDPSRVAAFVTFSVAMVTDRVDGELARRRGLVTDFGKIADPIADKALTSTAFVGLSLLGELPWWVTVVVLVREIEITRAALRRHPTRRDACWPGRGLEDGPARLALGLYLLPLPASWHLVEVAAMAVAVVVTGVVLGVDYAAQAAHLLDVRTAARRSRADGPAV